MQRFSVFVFLLFVGTHAFAPAPIRWGGLKNKGFAIATHQNPLANTALKPPLRLTLMAQGGTINAGAVPRFIANADNTITWHATGWCVEASGDEVRVNHCNGRPNQLWNWLPWGPIQLKGSNKCFDVSGQSDLDGAPIELHECENKITETWRLEEPIPLPTSSRTSFSLSHVASFLSMVAIGAISVAASLRLWSRRGRAIHQSNVPLKMDHDGFCSTEPVVTQRNSHVIPSVMALDPASPAKDRIGVVVNDRAGKRVCRMEVYRFEQLWRVFEEVALTMHPNVYYQDKGYEKLMTHDGRELLPFHHLNLQSAGLCAEGQQEITLTLLPIPPEKAQMLAMYTRTHPSRDFRSNASDEAKKDKDLVRTALSTVYEDAAATYILPYVSPELLKDREFAMCIVSEVHAALQYFADFRHDPEIVKAAVSFDGDNLVSAAPTLQTDREVVMAAVRSPRCTNSGSVLRYASEELKGDREIVLAAVARDGHAIRQCASQLTKDAEIVRTAVENDGLVLQFASEELKEDKEIVLAAVENNGRALEFVAERLKNDKDVVLKAVQENGRALQHAAEKLTHDKDVVRAAASHRRNDCGLKYASDELKGDEEMVLTCLPYGSWAFRHAADSLKQNKEFVMRAIGLNAGVLEFVPHFRDDEEVVLKAIEGSAHAIFDAAPELRQDKEFGKRAVQVNPAVADWVS